MLLEKQLLSQKVVVQAININKREKKPWTTSLNFKRSEMMYIVSQWSLFWFAVCFCDQLFWYRKITDLYVHTQFSVEYGRQMTSCGVECAIFEKTVINFLRLNQVLDYLFH